MIIFKITIITKIKLKYMIQDYIAYGYLITNFKRLSIYNYLYCIYNIYIYIIYIIYNTYITYIT